MKIRNNLKKLIKKNKIVYEIVNNIYKILMNVKLKYFSGTYKDIFTNIYLNNKWGDNHSCSGPGSNLNQTKVVLKELSKLITSYKIKNFLDIPCGDFYWLKEFDFKGINYLGADIVSELVNINIEKFKCDNINFANLDLISDNLPDADIIFIRDCLVHFSFKDIFKTLKNIKKTNSKFILTTTFFQRSKNKDISTGAWRAINLCKPPFNFPNPILTINEKCTENNNQYTDKALSLWELKQIPDY